MHLLIKEDSLHALSNLKLTGGRITSRGALKKKWTGPRILVKKYCRAFYDSVLFLIIIVSGKEANLKVFHYISVRFLGLSIMIKYVRVPYVCTVSTGSIITVLTVLLTSLFSRV